MNDPHFTSYQGMSGGLYPASGNLPPGPHRELSLRQASLIQPLNRSGQPDPSGRVVLLSIGMSNTTQEYSEFIKLASQQTDLHPQLELIDGAQGGWTPDRILQNGATFWATIENRLNAASLSAAQVQAIWLKEAHAQPRLPFPQDAQALQVDLRKLILELKVRFPNLRLVYLSSRTYGGYASTALNPEPFAYQSAFAVKWLIEDQLNGDPELDVESGRAPWIGWGPYLWADGETLREDGLSWVCSDFVDSDGTHPSPNGRRKVAAMLLDFLRTEPSAQPWFLRSSYTGAPPQVLAAVNSASYAAAIAPGSLATLFGSGLSREVSRAGELPLPHSLAGVQVLVGGEPACLLYVSPTQINFLMPKAPHSSIIQVIRQGIASNQFLAKVEAAAPGIFTLDADPGGMAAILHSDYSLVAAGSPARPGELLQLYWTGFGSRHPLSTAPEPEVQVLVEGLPAQIQYAGKAPGYPGLSQMNFFLPETARKGLLPILVRVGEAESNTAQIAVE